MLSAHVDKCECGSVRQTVTLPAGWMNMDEETKDYFTEIRCQCCGTVDKPMGTLEAIHTKTGTFCWMTKAGKVRERVSLL